MTDRKRKLSTLVIGCGNIAGGFDMEANNTAGPCTHAGAYRQHGHFRLAACVDPNRQRRQRFQEYWSIPAGYDALGDIPASTQLFDVISVCSPTYAHQQDIEAAIALAPRVIFCEKPLTDNLTTTTRLIEQCQEKNIALVVNFTRQWDPDIQALKDAINHGDYGELRSVIGSYNKGIFNNGSHLLNTLSLLLGQLQIEYALPGISDYSASDPSISALLSSKPLTSAPLNSKQGCPIHLVTAHAQDYTLFELQFIFQHRVVHMHEGGLFWSDRFIKASERFHQYRTIDAGNLRQGRYQQAMLAAVDNIYHFIQDKQALRSTGAAALETQKLCTKLWQRSTESRGAE